MKYHIPGLIIVFLGLGFAMVCTFIGAQQDSDLKTLIFMAVGLAVFAVCAGFDSDTRIRHHRNILKKAGLWTDDEIRKKDLKKPDEP